MNQNPDQEGISRENGTSEKPRRVGPGVYLGRVDGWGRIALEPRPDLFPAAGIDGETVILMAAGGADTSRLERWLVTRDEAPATRAALEAAAPLIDWSRVRVE